VETPDDSAADEARGTGGTIAGRFEIHPPLRESSAGCQAHQISDILIRLSRILDFSQFCIGGSENDLAHATHRPAAIFVAAATRIAAGVSQGVCFVRWMRQAIFRSVQDV
jgi:hypothetical protein